MKNGPLESQRAVFLVFQRLVMLHEGDYGNDRDRGKCHPRDPAILLRKLLAKRFFFCVVTLSH
jgi:hypothetical protein